MSTAHFSASFRNSCVIAPRHPDTKLPTTVVERKSIELSRPSSGIDAQGFSKTPSPYLAKEGNKAKKQMQLSRNEYHSLKKSAPTDPMRSLSPEKAKSKSIHKNSRESLINSKQPGDYNLKLYSSSSPADIQNLISSDDKFFRHLHALKTENKRTLKTLERLYGYHIQDQKEFAHEQSRNVVDLSSTFERAKKNASLAWDSDKLYQSVVQARESSEKFEVDNQEFAEHGSKNSTSDLHASPSKSDTFENGRPSNSSEDEYDQRLKVNIPDSHVNILPEGVSEFRGRSSSYDVVASMWQDFSVDDYAPYTRRKPRKKPDAWSPTITVPEPFQMTLREATKVKKKSKKREQIELELLRKRMAEEAELQKRVVPVPIPPSTFLPVYEELKAKEEDRRQYVRQISKEVLKSTEKPFSFLKREQAKMALRRSQSLSGLNKMEDFAEKKSREFKAHPFPDKLFDLTLADKMAEEEEYRKIKVKLRAEEMLASSSLPPNMKARGAGKHYQAREKTKRVQEDLRRRARQSFAPEINPTVPDFEVLQKRFQQDLELKKEQSTTPTVCEPFQLRTSRIPERWAKFNEKIEERKVQEKPPSGRSVSSSVDGSRASPFVARGRETDRNMSTARRSRSVSRGSASEESITYSLTESARLRLEVVRKSLESSEQKLAERSKQDKLRQERLADLRKEVALKAQAQDPSRCRDEETKEKMKLFKEADESRKREYRAYLHELESKLQTRPLLFERTSHASAKQKAERRYREILQQAGVDESVLTRAASADVGSISSDVDGVRDASDADDGVSDGDASSWDATDDQENDDHGSHKNASDQKVDSEDNEDGGSYLDDKNENLSEQGGMVEEQSEGDVSDTSEG